MKKWKIIKYSKKIEQLLTENFHANGKGLHSKLTSVENRLSPNLVKKIRFIATIRNKLVHEEDFNKIPKDFLKTNKEVVAELSKQKQNIWSWIIYILLLIVLALLLYYRFRNGFS